MGIFHDKERNQVYSALDTLREGLIDLISSDAEFIECITLGTSQVDRVRRRFDLARNLVDSILRNHRVQPRCFTRQLKEELYGANPTCALCNQRISMVDDAAVDHIKQYWQGGQTIPENARLSHRYCNMARSRRD